MMKGGMTFEMKVALHIANHNQGKLWKHTEGQWAHERWDITRGRSVSWRTVQALVDRGLMKYDLWDFHHYRPQRAVLIEGA